MHLQQGWYLTTTDKSKKMVLTTVDSYFEGLLPNTEKDTPVSLEEVTVGEELIYNTTALHISIFGIGKDGEVQPDLITQALNPVFCAVTDMSGLPKDHKQRWTSCRGHP